MLKYSYGLLARKRIVLTLCAVLFGAMGGLVSCVETAEPQKVSRLVLPEHVELTPLRTLPHATNAYCQGLLVETDVREPEIFYESCGRYGRSRVRQVEVATGATKRETALPADCFGEGLAAVGTQLYQLTWREQTGFIYDKSDLKLVGEFRYPGEGWGLTFDGLHLILSDGTDRLRFFSPDGMKKKREVSVFFRDKKTGKKSPIRKLNELEFVEGEIWANMYQTPFIARIDPSDGHVIEFLDFSAFVPKGFVGDPDRVLNGIAWNPKSRRLYLTGKDWPVMYELGIKNDSDADSNRDEPPAAKDDTR